MAVSGTSNSGVITSTAPTTSTASAAASAVSTNSIDVATIVSQLMTVENQPLDALKAKITGVQTTISDLGNMQSKITALQSALTTFEDPSTYNNPSASSSDNSVVTATASSNAAISTVNVSVSQLAAASKLVLKNVLVANTPTTYASATDSVPIDQNSGFTVTVGGNSYNTNDPSNALVPTGAGGATTLTDVKNWINGLGANVQASIVQTVSAHDFVLQISGTQTGSANAVSLDLGASTATQGSVASAQDAIATIGGITVNRSSNAISDVVNGITFNLVGNSTNGTSASITVQPGPDNSSAMINTLIKAYNDVVNQYNTYTANSNSGSSTATTNGDFANDPTMLSFVNNIKSMFAYGATDTTSATITGYGLASNSANIDTTNGYLQINSVKYRFSTIGQSDPTVSQFVTWVNGLNAGATASFNGSGISINNSQTGGSNSIDFSGVNNAIQRTTTSLAAMGMDIQLDGTMQFNTTSYQQAASSGLYSKLAKGLKMGFAGAGVSLDKFLISEIDPSKGALIQQITDQQNSITNMQKKQADIQSHLNQVQNNYITQYSALNALLFQLNSTSTSLASALAAVTNINAGK